jgi:hypothetical protein
MISAVASGAVHDLSLGFLLTVIPSIDVNAHALERGQGGQPGPAAWRRWRP